MQLNILRYVECFECALARFTLKLSQFFKYKLINIKKTLKLAGNSIPPGMWNALNVLRLMFP